MIHTALMLHRHTGALQYAETVQIYILRFFTMYCRPTWTRFAAAQYVILISKACLTLLYVSLFSIFCVFIFCLLFYVIFFLFRLFQHYLCIEFM
jgi:hypothetical protein